MGYSMGARIAAFLALLQPSQARSIILGGLGMHLIDGVGLPESIADALDAVSLDAVADPQGRLFRAFADQTRSDRRALAACIRGSRQTMGAILLNGARIGKHSLVGAGALVTEGKEFPPNSLIVGAPARAIKTLDEKAAKSVSFAAEWYVKRWNQYAKGLKRIG